LNPLALQADYFGAPQSAPQQNRQHGGVTLPPQGLRRNCPQEALALLKAQPIANLLTDLPNPSHATNSGYNIRTENTPICCLIRKPSNCREADINRGGGQLLPFQKRPILQDDSAIECKPRRGAVPGHEFIHCVLVGAPGLGRFEGVEY